MRPKNVFGRTQPLYPRPCAAHTARGPAAQRRARTWHEDAVMAMPAQKTSHVPSVAHMVL